MTTTNAVIQITNIATPKPRSPFENRPNIDYSYDWRRYFDPKGEIAGHQIKDPADWQTIYKQIGQLKTKLDKKGINTIHVFGSVRLSVCMVLGYIFRETTGYDILFRHKIDSYPTVTRDTVASSATLEPAQIMDPTSNTVAMILDLQGPERSIYNDALQALSDHGATVAAVQRLVRPNKDIDSAEEAIAIAKDVKTAMQQLVRDHKATTIWLFNNGPQFAAITIGYYLNAVGAPIQITEYNPSATPVYQKAFLIQD